jgi:hypothetical protein
MPKCDSEKNGSMPKCYCFHEKLCMNDGFLTHTHAHRQRQRVAEFKGKMNQGLWARKEITCPFYL